MLMFMPSSSIFTQIELRMLSSRFTHFRNLGFPAMRLIISCLPVTMLRCIWYLIESHCLIYFTEVCPRYDSPSLK